MSDDGVSRTVELEGENQPSSSTAALTATAPEKAATADDTATAVENREKLTVIYTDEDIAVLDKPSGLRTVPGRVTGPEAKTRAHVRVLSHQHVLYDIARQALCSSPLVQKQQWVAPHHRSALRS